MKTSGKTYAQTVKNYHSLPLPQSRQVKTHGAVGTVIIYAGEPYAGCGFAIMAEVDRYNERCQSTTRANVCDRVEIWHAHVTWGPDGGETPGESVTVEFTSDLFDRVVKVGGQATLRELGLC